MVVDCRRTCRGSTMRLSTNMAAPDSKRIQQRPVTVFFQEVRRVEGPLVQAAIESSLHQNLS